MHYQSFNVVLIPIYRFLDAASLPLVFAPESGNMLGGTIVNITGPCFDTNDRVLCTFDTESVQGEVVDRNRAICVQPFLMAQGYIRFQISIGTDRFKWRGLYFVGMHLIVDITIYVYILVIFNVLHLKNLLETPATATDRIFFRNNDVYEKAPNEIQIEWNRFNLTTNLNAQIKISLYGYRESTIRYVVFPQHNCLIVIDRNSLIQIINYNMNIFFFS